MVFSCGSWHYAAATQRRTHCFGVGWTNTWWLSANRLPSQKSTVLNIIERETVVMRLTGAAYKPNEGSPMAAVGTELILINNLAIRAGSKINHSVQSWSAGLGYTVALADKHLVFDYSISEFDVLGSVHRVGLSLGL